MRRLGALAVDDCCARACFPARLLAHRDVKRMVDALQRAVPIPQLEIMVHRAFRRQILGQRLPLAAGPQQVQKAVDNLAHVDVPRPAATSCRRDHRLHQNPFFIGEITRITETLTPCRSTMFRCPHRRSLPQRISAHQGITTDSSDSTSSWIGSKVVKRCRSVIRLSDAYSAA